MKRSTRIPWLFVCLLLTLLSTTAPASLSATKPGLDSAYGRTAAAPGVALRAASGATIPYLTQNGQTVAGISPRTEEIPHLVLFHNGILGSAEERTLIVEVFGLAVPPAGITITLQIETQHGDPDTGSESDRRMPVWRESLWVANTSDMTRTGVNATFVHEFTETTMSGSATIATPTDYFRYDVTVTDSSHPLASPARVFSLDYAFLMENQWIAPLPEVREASPGAAPDELVVYYCDMFPFERDPHDLATRLCRREVTGYVGTELAPQMAEALRVQSQVWGFPWYEAWSSYRFEEPERLSVALVGGQMWFHGAAPSGGHSAISIQVKGGNNTAFPTLADGLMSTFHHELFHNVQRSINLHSGGDGDVDGAQNAWQFFSEGTAVLADSVGQPRGQFSQALPARTYMSYANGFLWRNSGPAGGLNIRYGEMDPYQAAIYWRFLYERCGGMHDGSEDPAAGMQVIRRALTVLYSGEVVDIRYSTDLVGAMPEVMDRALAGSLCPFQTYEDSLAAFACSLYALRLEGGRYAEKSTPGGSGLYDPYKQYRDPPIRTIAYAGEAQAYQDGIGSSFGIDLYEVLLEPATDGQRLTLEFYGDPASEAEFDVQVWLLANPGEGTQPRRVSAVAAAVEVPGRTDPDGRRIYALPAAGRSTYNGVGLIVVRRDAREAVDGTGSYTVVLHPGAAGRAYPG